MRLHSKGISGHAARGPASMVNLNKLLLVKVSPTMVWWILFVSSLDFRLVFEQFLVSGCHNLRVQTVNVSCFPYV